MHEIAFYEMAYEVPTIEMDSSFLYLCRIFNERSASISCVYVHIQRLGSGGRFDLRLGQVTRHEVG